MLYTFQSNPEQGLDEVPTRLLNAIDSAANPGSGVGRFYSEESTENRIPSTQRCAHFSHQSTPANNSANDQTLTSNHLTESSSGKFECVLHIYNNYLKGVSHAFNRKYGLYFLNQHCT